MDSSVVKQQLMQKVQVEAQTANLRMLLEVRLSLRLIFMACYTTDANIATSRKSRTTASKSVSPSPAHPSRAASKHASRHAWRNICRHGTRSTRRSSTGCVLSRVTLKGLNAWKEDECFSNVPPCHDTKKKDVGWGLSLRLAMGASRAVQSTRLGIERAEIPFGNSIEHHLTAFLFL